jgi:DNA-binding NtrC family response regulator
MNSDNIVLVEVEDPFRGAFEAATTDTDLTTVNVMGASGAAADGSDPALAVVGSGPTAEVMERIRSVKKVLRDTPIVTLIRDGDLRTELAISKESGVATASLAGDPEETVRLCLTLIHAPGEDPISELVGDSVEMHAFRRSLHKVARCQTNVLLTGETGTGKNLAARAIHRLSDRRDMPFVQVDCSSLSPTVIESELFGHEKGAYTGAVGKRAGRFELVEEGTVFLDEIGELDASLQVKFLRVLEEREFERVGGGTTQRMRARVIAATNTDLARAIERGRFRADLYYRLCVVSLDVPPLRQRRSDIPGLVKFAIERLSRRLQLHPPTVSTSFCARLMSEPWPGNVRELVNALEAVLVQNYSPHLEARHLDGIPVEPIATPCALPKPTEPSIGDLRDPVDEEEAERQLLSELLVSTGGNVARMSRRLGIPRTTVRYRIRRHGLTDLIPKD